MKPNKCFTLLAACMLFFGACNDDKTDFGNEGVVIDTPSCSEITGSSVQLEAVLSASPDIILGKRGFCYSKEQHPDIYDATLTGTTDGNVFTATLENLPMNVTYYVRAFACIYPSGVVYSPEITVQTGESNQNEQLAAYEAPAYADNYASIAAWSNRDQWNLANVHDPSVVLAEDGYYYMYQTDASYGNVHTAGGHFHARRSQDLVNWEYLGGTMQNLPEWVIPKLNEIRKGMGLDEYVQPADGEFGYWAPCVRKVQNGLYRMYYSIVVPGHLSGDNSWSERAFIGMMENTDPADNDGWVDKGYIVTNASDKGLNFQIAPDDWANCYYKWNAIDPGYIITPEGTHWLIYGSWHSGIVAMELDAGTGMPKNALGIPWAEGNAPAEYGQLIATRQAGNRWQASEGPEIIYRNGYYYLFLAYDALAVPYNTRVVRATSITGPYYGIDGTNVTEGGDAYPVVTHPYKFNGSDGWVGLSHCAVFDDGNDHWYYASQGRLPESIDNAIMMGHIRSIRWTSDGWPVVMPERYGAVPAVEITESELIGTWEHIDLSYSYGVQKTAETITLGEDYKVNGGNFDGQTWIYDAANQRLKIGTVELCLQRETDWEASPRTHTLVYAGYDGTGTYWGKKSK